MAATALSPTALPQPADPLLNWGAMLHDAGLLGAVTTVGTVVLMTVVRDTWQLPSRWALPGAGLVGVLAAAATLILSGVFQHAAAREEHARDVQAWMSTAYGVTVTTQPSTRCSRWARRPWAAGPRRPC